MGKTQKYEKYCLRLDKDSKTKENLAKVISKFEKLCNGDISEDAISTSHNIEKQYGISFIEDFKGKEKEIGSVSFNSLLEYKKFCEMLEICTSTFDERGLPKIEYNNIADPFPFFSYSIDVKDYNHITREDFKSKFPEYPLGNVDAKPVIRCVYGDLSDEDAKIDKLYLHNNLEIKYYGYDERNNIRTGYSIAEFGFLTTIAGNEVFVYNQEELKELLNGLCLGEEELCREKVLVKKSL